MNRLVIESDKYLDIPYSVYQLEGIKSKGLLFVQHGFESNRFRGGDYLALPFARLGYTVVAIDAYKHGERIQEPFVSRPEHERYASLFEVVEHTVEDIIRIYEDVFSKDFEIFDFIGVSMGGFIAYLLSLKVPYIRKLVPAITSPKFSEIVRSSATILDADKYNILIEETLEHIKDIDPYLHKESLQFEEMLIINGDEDPLIRVSHAKDFYKETQDKNIDLKIYHAQHEITGQMIKDIISFINEKAVL
jgi:esterase/lipase